MFDQTHQVEHLGKTYQFTHGDPFDRGMSDSYYGRRASAHKGGVGGSSGPRNSELTAKEIEDYHAGYAYNESIGDKKEW